MKSNLLRNIGLLTMIIVSPAISGQFRGSNLAEYQFGNIPDVEPANLNSFYNQLNLSYRYKGFSASTRLEGFISSYGENKDYIKPTQFKASYVSKHLGLDAGSIYSSFGRGLLMRNYEIPSSIFESRGYRVRHGFYKDMQGFSAQFKSKYINVKLLRGKTLTVDLPPTIDRNERRTDLVEGGEVEGKLKNQSIGLIYMRHLNNGKVNNYISAYYNGNIKDFNIYGELAKKVDSLNSITSFTSRDAWGGYVGLSYTWQHLGLSLEYKNYHDFLIGNGVNEPPTLVKEHNSIVLNRSTHVPLINNEKGFQAEVYYSFENGNGIVLNHSLSQNNVAGTNYVFKEFYADLTAHIGKAILTRTFIDYAIDPLLSEVNRYAVGTSADIEHSDRYSSTINIEYQRIERETGTMTNYINNGVFSYTLSKVQKYSFSALLEVSNDQYLLTDNATNVFYPAVSASYHLGRKNKVVVFVGKRRGGPACSSGVCYDVLDFKGLEIRLTTRF